jgi:hypothetical protein
VLNGFEDIECFDGCCDHPHTAAGYADLLNQALKAYPTLASLEKAQQTSNPVESESVAGGRRPIEAVLPELASRTLGKRPRAPLPRTPLCLYAALA